MGVSIVSNPAPPLLLDILASVTPSPLCETLLPNLILRRQAMDNDLFPDSMTATKRGRPAAKNVEDRIAALSEKIAALRAQQSARQRKQTAELVRIIGSVMLAAVNDNDDAG